MTTVTTPAATDSARWATFRTALETQRADCIREREAALAETVASLPDPVAVQRSATLHQTIQDIDAALARIEAGTYGRCVRCDTAIPEERLEFRPFAATCVSCQSAR